MESTLTSKGQITIPKEARESLGIGPGDRVKFFFDVHGHLAIRPAISIISLKGIVKSRLGRPVTLEEMERVPEEGAVERYKRAIRKR